MRWPLLRCVQQILSSMDSEEINDIWDTTESNQVVDILEQTYYDVCAQVDFPDHWDLFELQPSNDPSRPTLMYLPPNIGKMEWIQYDVSDPASSKRDFRYIRAMERKFFFERMNSLDTANSEIYQYNLLVGPETFDIRGYNNRHPSYYTTADNGRTLIFDSFMYEHNPTLVGNRTKCYGMLYPVFERDNDFVPDFEPRQFTLFFNEAKAQAFLELKQVENPKAEQRARRGWNLSGRKKDVTAPSPIHHSFTYPFGRRGKKVN